MTSKHRDRDKQHRRNRRREASRQERQRPSEKRAPSRDPRDRVLVLLVIDWILAVVVLAGLAGLLMLPFNPPFVQKIVERTPKPALLIIQGGVLALLRL